MNKRLFFGMFVAAGMLVTTSCSNEDPYVASSGNEVQVSFSLGLENGISTRAISDGTGADHLVYAVFDSEGNRISGIAAVDKDATFPAEETLTLAKGQTYKVAFWAQNKACTAYTVDPNTMCVTVNYADAVNNDETRDAFFKTVQFTVTGATSIDVELKRPFAQINVGVTDDDWNAAVASGIEIEKSSVVVKQAATKLDLLTGATSDPVDVAYALGEIPAETLSVDTDKDGMDESYKWMSMSYILVNDGGADGSGKTTLEGLQFTLSTATGDDIILDNGLNSVPVRRNWRTNILGNLLSGNVTFNISIDPIYDGDYNNGKSNEIAPGVVRDGDTYRISTRQGLKWFAEVVNGTAKVTSTNRYDPNFIAQQNFNGKTVILTADLDMKGMTWTPIGGQVAGDGLGKAFSGTFDGNNHTINGLTVKGDEYVGLFGTAVGTIKNLKMTNVKATGTHYVAAVVGYSYGNIENCHVDGATVTAEVKDKDNGDKAGAIVGYVGEGNMKISDCSVNNATITAYRDVAGIAGCINTGVTVENNTVSDSKIIANQLVEYGSTSAANAGKVVGRNIADADLASNTASNVIVDECVPDENGTVEIGNVPLAVIAYLNNPNVKEVKLNYDVTGTAAVKNPYSLLSGVLQNGVTIDGGGHTLNANKATWIIETHGGVIKNLTIEGGGERGICTYTPTQDVVIENVIIDNPGYAFNTAEHATVSGLKLIARNSTFNGWTSFAGGFESAEFTECSFGENSTKYWQNFGYDRDFDRLVKPYINTLFKNCKFEQMFYIDFSALGSGCKIVFDQCTVDGTVLTLDNIATLLGLEPLPEGKTLSDYLEFK